MKILGTRVFRNLESEGRENERVLKFGVEVGKSSPTVAIQSKFMRSNDYFIKFHMSRLPCQVEIICYCLNFGQTLKLPAGKIPRMSRHKISYRDILNPWWDKSSLGCDSKYFLYVL